MSWEVPTMQSRTSFFNPTVFWSDQRRFWPLTAGFALLWFLLLPFSRLSEYSYSFAPPEAADICRETLNLAGTGGYWVAFLTAIFFAMAAFSYLTNPRATNGLHALPARRETLYLTHYLSGLCAQLAAQLAATVLTWLVLSSHNAIDLRVTGLLLLALVLPTLFFYSFGVLCMIFTGQILAAPVFYGVLNVVVVGVETLLRVFAGNYLYGWADGTNPCLTAFSPIVQLVDNGVRATGEFRSPDADGGLALLGLDWLLIYAAAGLVLAALGLLVYRSRHSEATGSIVAVGWARPVFKYGVTFCAALALGQLFYYLFFGRYRSSGDYSLVSTLLCMAAAGLIGYFAAEMLLKKSFRVLRSGWKGAAAVTAVLIAMGFVMSLDLTGYEGYVPDPEQVRSASVEWYGQAGGSDIFAVVSDAETIRLVTDAHRAIARDKQRQLSLLRGDGDFFHADTDREINLSWIGVTYQMKNGATVSRRYARVRFWADELGDPSSPAAAMTALCDAPNVVLQRALGSYGASNSGDPRELVDLRFTGGTVSIDSYDGNGMYEQSYAHELSPAEAKQVYETILRDVESGRVHGSLFSQSKTLLGDLELYATYLDTRDYSGEPRRRDRVFTPRLTAEMTETLAVLSAMGVEFPLR